MKIRKVLFFTIAMMFMLFGCDSSEVIETETIDSENEEETEYIEEDETLEENVMIISVNGTNLIAVMEENSSVTALMELLEEGPLTIEMIEYANM